MSIWSITGGVHFDRLVKAAAGFLPSKVAFFPFVINNYLVGDTVRLSVSCFSSYFCSLISATTDDSSVKQSLLWDLPNSDCPSLRFLLHLLARILFLFRVLNLYLFIWD